MAKVKQRKAALKKRKPIAAGRKRIAALVEKEGYSLSELFGGREERSKVVAPRAAAKKGRKLGMVAPKYRNPANAKETWSGRGLQPRWLAELVRQGRQAEEFLIEQVRGGAARRPAARTARKATSKTKRPAGKTQERKRRKKTTAKQDRKHVRSGKSVPEREKPVGSSSIQQK